MTILAWWENDGKRLHIFHSANLLHKYLRSILTAELRHCLPFLSRLYKSKIWFRSPLSRLDWVAFATTQRRSSRIERSKGRVAWWQLFVRGKQINLYLYSAMKDFHLKNVPRLLRLIWHPFFRTVGQTKRSFSKIEANSSHESVVGSGGMQGLPRRSDNGTPQRASHTRKLVVRGIGINCLSSQGGNNIFY